MKKLIYMFSTLILCFAFMNDVSADEKICIYSKAADQNISAVLRANGKGGFQFDIYRDTRNWTFNPLNLSNIEKSKGVVSPPGVTYNFSDPCPKKICENSIDFTNNVVIADICILNWTFNLVSEQKLTDLSNSFDEILAYKYGNANPSLTYNTVLNGGCPSSVAAFKLLKSAYSLIKIGAPLTLVVFATIDMAKAAATSDESTIKKTQKHCLKRFAAAVIVLLSFVIIEMIVNLVSGGSEVMSCLNEFLK